jgi:hypothetical protein
MAPMTDAQREQYMEAEAKAHHDERRYHGPLWCLPYLSQAQRLKIDAIMENLKKTLKKEA